MRVLGITQSDINATSTNKNSGTNVIYGTPTVQTVLLDGSKTVGSVVDADYDRVGRLRPRVFLKNYQNGNLTIDMPKESIKSISDESFTVYRTYNAQSINNGGTTITLGENEQFETFSNDNFVVTIDTGGGSNNDYAGPGTKIDMEAAVNGGTIATVSYTHLTLPTNREV